MKYVQIKKWLRENAVELLMKLSNDNACLTSNSKAEKRPRAA